MEGGVKVEIKNFKKEELACPCCQLSGVKEEALMRLQVLRDLCDFPLQISSGYRCKKYNEKKIKGSPKSRHLTGEAFDISTKSLRAKQKFKLLQEVIHIFKGGIGIYDMHIHVDTRSQGVLWVGVSR